MLVGISSALVLSGCSAPASRPESKPSVTVAQLSPEEAKAQFETIANASCDKAMAEGVVEQSISSDGFTLVMVPKEEGYKDFSAAYFEPADTYELICEADAFSACAASISFSLAAEAGVESDIEVAFNATDSTFETTQDLGEFGISRLRYNVENGLLSQIEILDSAVADVRAIRYGNLSDEHWQILRTAVDRFLAEN